MTSVSGKRRPTCAFSITGTDSSASRISSGRTANRLRPGLRPSHIPGYAPTPGCRPSSPRSGESGKNRFPRTSRATPRDRQKTSPPPAPEAPPAGTTPRRCGAGSPGDAPPNAPVTCSTLSRGRFRRRTFVFPNAKATLISFLKLRKPALCHTRPPGKTIFRTDLLFRPYSKQKHRVPAKEARGCGFGLHGTEGELFRMSRRPPGPFRWRRRCWPSPFRPPPLPRRLEFRHIRDADKAQLGAKHRRQRVQRRHGALVDPAAGIAQHGPLAL